MKFALNPRHESSIAAKIIGPRFHSLQFLFERVASLSHAQLADKGGAILVPAQMTDAPHILGSLHGLNKSNPVAMRASKGVQLLLRSWTRYDGISLRLSHSANICEETAVPV